MKKNIIILLITFGIAVITTSFRQIDYSGSLKVNNTCDTTYYHVLISIERVVTEEFIKTYEFNKKLVADIFVVSYQERSYVGKSTIRYYQDSSRMEKLTLTSRKTDTLNMFKNMVTTNSIRHNQGLKLAGRHGVYSIVLKGDTARVESRELYSLVDAINFVRK